MDELRKWCFLNLIQTASSSLRSDQPDFFRFRQHTLLVFRTQFYIFRIIDPEYGVQLIFIFYNIAEIIFHFLSLKEIDPFSVNGVYFTITLELKMFPGAQWEAI